MYISRDFVFFLNYSDSNDRVADVKGCGLQSSHLHDGPWSNRERHSDLWPSQDRFWRWEAAEYVEDLFVFNIMSLIKPKAPQKIFSHIASNYSFDNEALKVWTLSSTVPELWENQFLDRNIMYLRLFLIRYQYGSLVWRSRPFTFYYRGRGEGKGPATPDYRRLSLVYSFNVKHPALISFSA